MSEQKDLFVLSVLLWDYFLYMGEAGKASPWTLSEVLLMMFQRRVSLSDYEDMFFSSVSPSFWLGVRGSSFTLRSSSSHQCSLYQYHHPRLDRDLKVAVLKYREEVEGEYCLF